MKQTLPSRVRLGLAVGLPALLLFGVAHAQEAGRSSYSPVDIKEALSATVARMEKAKP